MECLVKYVSERFNVEHYLTYNDFPRKRYKTRTKFGIWTYREQSTGQEVFLKHFADKTCSVQLNRKTIVLEKEDHKVSLKIFDYGKERRVGTHFFKFKQFVRFITYNKKTNIIYVGNKNGKKSSIRSNSFSHTEINSFFNFLYETLKHHQFVPEDEIQDSNKMLFDIINLFCVESLEGFDKTQQHLLLDCNSLFLQNYLKKNNVIIPDNYKAFFQHRQVSLRDIKRAKNNLLLAVEKKYKIRGKKFHRVLHTIKSFNHDFVYAIVDFFGTDRLKHVLDNELKILFEYGNGYILTTGFHEYKSEFSDVEKDRMLPLLIDCIRNNGSVHTFMDHMSFIFRLRYEYNENVGWNSKNRNEFTNEHILFSSLISKHQNGVYDRLYSEDFVNSLNTEFISNGGVFYPVLLMKDEEYRNESEIQHNCVKTYNKRVTCFIISLREGSTDSKERATIQYEIEYQSYRTKFVRTQTLGRFNKNLTEKWDDPLKMLDRLLDSVTSKFNINDYKIKKTTIRGEKIFDMMIDKDSKKPSLVLESEKNEENLLEISF